MRRTTVKLILACTLLLGTAFLPLSSQATTCCLNCQNTLDTCEINCNHNNTCLQNCVNAFSRCSKGCGPGGCPV